MKLLSYPILSSTWKCLQSMPSHHTLTSLSHKTSKPVKHTWQPDRGHQHPWVVTYIYVINIYVVKIYAAEVVHSTKEFVSSPVMFSPTSIIHDEHMAAHCPIRRCHWGRDKMPAIFQTTFSNTFSWMKMYEFWLKFHWSLFLRVKLTIIQHWFR